MIKKYYLFFLLLIIFIGCKKMNDITPESRSFYMGFQPWVHDLNHAAKIHVYDNIAKYGDIISTQLDNGVPWEQALTGTDFPSDVQSELDERKSLIPSNAKVFLSLMPLSEGRTGLASYWGTEDEEIKQQWANRNFADSLIIKAYLNYCRRMIHFFQPDYLCYAVEANSAFCETDTTYQEFLIFCDTVYGSLKNEYPDLPIMLSLGTNLLGGGGDIIEGTTKQLLQYSDYVAMSTYPFLLPNIQIGNADPQLIPDNWFKRMPDLAPDKPVCITETGYIAEDLDLPAYFIDLKGREVWQAAYVQQLFEEMNQLNAEFIIWFTPRDYNYAGEKLEGIVDLSFYIWIDTGILDEDGRERQSAKIWKAWKEIPIQI